MENSAVFDSFIIRPKVCDWLSHCEDVIETNRTDVTKINQNSIQSTIKFKFNPKFNSEYIKLYFYVEYFKPSYLNKNINTIKFNLKLLHFGDPCYLESQCENSAKCVSDPIKQKANELVCECQDGWTGPLCKTKDYCRTIDNVLVIFLLW